MFQSFIILLMNLYKSDKIFAKCMC